MVVSIINVLEMNSKESKSFLILERLSLRDDIQQEAAHVICGIGKLINYDKLSESDRTKMAKNMVLHSGKFKELRRYTLDSLPV